MKCSQCKSELPKGAKFCTKCGGKVRHTGRNMAVILLLLVVAAGAGVFAFLRLHPDMRTREHFLDIAEELEGIGAAYTDADGYVTAEEADTLLAQVYARGEELYAEGRITDLAYEPGDSFVYMEIDGWLGYIYEARIAETMSGDGAERISVVTLEPFASEFATNVSYLMNGFNGPDEAAEAIAGVDSAFVFEGNYDNYDVDVDTVRDTFRPDSIILWEGHGGLSSSFGSILSLGEFAPDWGMISWYQRILPYKELFQDGALLLADTHVCVTPVFFEEYLEEGALEGSLVYLNACESLADPRLAQSLLDLGARCVVGNTAEIWMPYGMAMMYDFFEGMAQADADGQYATVTQALAYAKDEEGEYDPVQGGSVQLVAVDDFALPDMLEPYNPEGSTVASEEESTEPETGGETETEAPESAGSSLFQELPEEFVFSSGAGGWGTTLRISADGTFTGQYHDSDLGDTGSDYPNGTVYLCNFSGKFTTPEQVSQYVYSMELESLNQEGEVDTVYYEDGVRYILSEPYGMDEAGEFQIYLPGAPLAELPEGFLSWAFLSQEIRENLPDGMYGIYNVGGQEGFVGYGEDFLYHKNYQYTFGGTSSQLWPSCSGVSSLVFWQEQGSPVSLRLTFAWTDEEQTEFLATDTYGSDHYNYSISLVVSEDQSRVQVTVVSLEGMDLSPYGGTADGRLEAEYTLIPTDQ